MTIRCQTEGCDKVPRRGKTCDSCYSRKYRQKKLKDNPNYWKEQNEKYRDSIREANLNYYWKNRNHILNCKAIYRAKKRKEKSCASANITRTQNS